MTMVDLKDKEGEKDVDNWREKICGNCCMVYFNLYQTEITYLDTNNFQIINAMQSILCKGLFTYYVSQFWGFLDPPSVILRHLLADPPSPLRHHSPDPHLRIRPYGKHFFT